MSRGYVLLVGEHTTAAQVPRLVAQCAHQPVLSVTSDIREALQLVGAGVRDAVVVADWAALQHVVLLYHQPADLDPARPVWAHRTGS